MDVVYTVALPDILQIKKKTMMQPVNIFYSSFVQCFVNNRFGMRWGKEIKAAIFTECRLLMLVLTTTRRQTSVSLSPCFLGV